MDAVYIAVDEFWWIVVAGTTLIDLICRCDRASRVVRAGDVMGRPVTVAAGCRLAVNALSKRAIRHAVALGADVIQFEAVKIALAVTGRALDVGMAFLTGGFGMRR